MNVIWRGASVGNALISYGSKPYSVNSLSATGDRGRQPPPSSALTRGDQSRHNNS